MYEHLITYQIACYNVYVNRMLDRVVSCPEPRMFLPCQVVAVVITAKHIHFRVTDCVAHIRAILSLIHCIALLIFILY